MKNKRILLFFIFLLSVVAGNAQNPTYQQKLYYTCKVWGFVKYFHSRVSVCEVNWDSVLIADLPLVKSAVTTNDFNNALDTMLKAAGPMAVTSTPRPDTMAPELKRNLNFGWISDPILRADVQTQLDTIRNNFRPHPECWVEVNPGWYSGGWLYFQGGDSLILNIDDVYNYPDEPHRLWEVFAFWNIAYYFHPSNCIENQPWDSALYQNIISLDNATYDNAFYTAFLKLATNMNDSHVQALTSDYYSYSPILGGYTPRYLILKSIPGKYLVEVPGLPSLTPGDEILSVNGLTTKQWEDSLGPYIPSSDSAFFRLAVSNYMICSTSSSNMSITFSDSLNNIHAINPKCVTYDPTLFYYPNDTLMNVQWRYWSNCNIGFINIGIFEDTGLANVYSTLQNADAIIFDVRTYSRAYGIYDMINNFLFPAGNTPVTKWMNPDVTYPGTYYWDYSYVSPGSSNPFKGKVIILSDEQSISAAEYISMTLAQLPNAIKVGSQTDGADGNVTYFNLNQDIVTGFTSLGTFYPNGDSTRRIGIIPDSVVYPTRTGLYHHRDEELEKALQIAGCLTAVKEVKRESETLKVYPNPNDGIFTLSLSNVTEKCRVEIYNVIGEKVMTEILPSAQDDKVIDLSNQPNGIYFYRVINEDGGLIGEGKVVIEK